jgi:hypothetical protein
VAGVRCVRQALHHLRRAAGERVEAGQQHEILIVDANKKTLLGLSVGNAATLDHRRRWSGTLGRRSKKELCHRGCLPRATPGGAENL